MSDKYINISLDDEKTVGIAEILSNRTSKRILSLLADKEMSESDVAQELKIPLNTTGYNIKKLIDAGLIERAKNFFWSVKGKRIPTYRVVNKKIIISPKTSFKGIIPSILISALISLGIRSYVDNRADEVYVSMPSIASTASEKIAATVAQPEVYYPLINAGNNWVWFLFGALVALLIFAVWNWRKIW